MKILLLSRYGRLGASSRLRFYQYIPYLQSCDITFSVAPLFDDWYLESLYSGKPISWYRVIFAYGRRILQVASYRQYNLIWIECEILPWIGAFLERWLSALGIPLVVDYDDAIFHRYDQHPNRLVRWLLGRKIDIVMSQAAIVIVGNDYLRFRAIEAGAQRVEWLPTSVDLARYPSPSPQTLPNEIFTIGWIGSPSTAHYLNCVHEALARICAEGQARVVLVGGGDPGFRDVPYAVHSWSEDTEVAEVSLFDVGIMPLDDSLWERGKCGYKLIQYMACGKPVIASPVGINVQIVEPGINGYLAKTTDDWIRALTLLMENPDLRRIMGAAGRAKVESDFSVQSNAPRLAALLHSKCNAITPLNSGYLRSRE